MSIVSVRAALQTKLNSIAGSLSTVWENAPYTPIVGAPYQAAYVLSAEPENPTMGDDYYREQGIFQVSLFYPLQEGTAAAEARAQLIRTTFKRGTSIPRVVTDWWSYFFDTFLDVIVGSTPEIGNGRVDGDRWHVPVKIRWHAGIY